MNLFKTVLFVVFTMLGSISNALAQNNSVSNCSNLVNTDGYVSDGQEYLIKLDENNRARFKATFYGGSYYRIVGCTNISSSKMILTVYDTDKNILFCNKDYDYLPYWNFKFTSTVDCIIEFEFDRDIAIKEEVLLLIGFKEK
ncbi:MAG: hypothetical protein AB7S50_01275 [Bacteroidales bacterium]